MNLILIVTGKIVIDEAFQQKLSTHNLRSISLCKASTLYYTKLAEQQNLYVLNKDGLQYL